ncbi:TIGR03862 family flavoprotein [Aestuariirhabdus sp. LZHN29]|uniref:TIGR03862 family flavoprotein n=1 Tax=Aestuariirhabdus sp. LZHN29 TaxID=3417462 RepID=UPI003CE8A51C
MQTQQTVAIVGAGPAGLMAAEVIRAAGHRVEVYDAKPSACRKFLLAGIGGMNITHSEPYPQFIQRYYEKAQWLDRALSQFDADALRQWVHELGIDTFVGSSGRVFPLEMKAAPLLRSWLKRLRESGVNFHMKHRLVGMDKQVLEFEHAGARVSVEADAIVLAMGGASWPRLGSDGAWQSMLSAAGVITHPLQSANCGFLCQWSVHLQQRHAGSPLKNIAFHFTTTEGVEVARKGECILSHYGMEGSLIYGFSKYLRDAINQLGHARLQIDLLPSFTAAQLIKKLLIRKKKESFSKYLKRSTGLSGVKAALLYECFDKQQLQTPQQIAACIKAVPITFTEPSPIEKAISSAGGVCESSVDQRLMLNALPGVFCAGEMLDWEAPTGGYLLTACFATGRLAGQGVCHYMKASSALPT